MSKKSKKQNRPAPVAVPPEVLPKVSSTRSTIEEFNPDYTYVIKDLRRILILAGSFVVVLIVLSFLI